jgi:hypothetical protein
MSGPTGHVNPFVDVEIINLQLSNHLSAIKGPIPFKQRTQEYFPLSFSELLELSTHPHYNIVHL